MKRLLQSLFRIWHTPIRLGLVHEYHPEAGKEPVQPIRLRLVEIKGSDSDDMVLGMLADQALHIGTA